MKFTAALTLLIITVMNIRAQDTTKVDTSFKTKQLKQVVVTGRAPLVEQRMDRTIIHVDASPVNAGLNTLEILEKSPGISLDKDGNISLNGKPAPLVLIDGKPTYLGAADLVNLLSNTPGAQLDQIEIMTNPPARYDAAGNAGVINIRTKKLRQQGLNGSLTLGGGLGIHARSTNSANINYHTGKVNLFASYGYTYSDRKNEFDLQRNIRDQQTQSILQTFDQTTIFHPITQSHTFKAGLDYDIDKKTTLGFAVTGMFSRTREQTGDTTHILDGDHVPDSVTVSNSRQHDFFNNIGGNVNFRHAFHQQGQELTFDGDYLHYHSGSDQLFNNYFFDAKGAVLDPAEDLFVHLPVTIDIYTAKADYTQPLAKQVRLDLGAKASWVRADNNAGYFDGSNGAAPVDSSLTNHFIYKENIQAGYININKVFSPRWTAQAGLRAEHTSTEGNQVVGDQQSRRNYTQLFPTAYLEYTLNAANKLTLDYGRRILRPDYHDLNPFLYFLDKYTFELGNPNLQPQLSNTIELKHAFRDFLISGLSYSRTDHYIANIIDQVDSTKIAYQTSGNVATAIWYSASLAFNRAILPWWKLNIAVQEDYNHVKGTINNGPLDLEKYNFLGNLTSQFTFQKIWTVELSGFYNSGELEGTAKGHPYGTVNFGASRPVLNNKGTIRLSVRDLANLLTYNNDIRYQNNDMHGQYKPDTRAVSISFTYRFSRGKAVKQREHSSASEEEQSRVKTN